MGKKRNNYVGILFLLCVFIAVICVVASFIGVGLFALSWHCHFNYGNDLDGNSLAIFCVSWWPVLLMIGMIDIVVVMPMLEVNKHE